MSEPVNLSVVVFVLMLFGIATTWVCFASGNRLGIWVGCGALVLATGLGVLSHA